MADGPLDLINNCWFIAESTQYMQRDDWLWLVV